MSQENVATVLAGDFGGTKSRLAAYRVVNEELHELAGRDFESAAAHGLEEIVAAFLAETGLSCDAACFGLAGPVAGRRVRTTNLPWVVEAVEIERETGIPAVRLINDLEAAAWGVLAVNPADIRLLQEGDPGIGGNAAVIAAGTGLGEAGIFSDGDITRPFASEGGHASFSPTDELTDGLLRFLRRRFDTVSWERVVSGPGLTNIYRYFVEKADQQLGDWFQAAENDQHEDPASAISQRALDGSCELCVRALDLFVRLYGEEAGNLALKFKSTGGVWVGGGIAPKILPAIESGTFMRGFLAKGRMRPLLEAMPVRVVLDDRIALRGAARRAAVAARARER